MPSSRTTAKAQSCVSQETNIPINHMDSNLYWAAVNGKIETFKEALRLDHLLTPENNTVLHVHMTADVTDKTFAEEILRMCPTMLLQTNGKGETPLFMAARYGHARIVEFLINHAKLFDHPVQNDLESAAGEAGSEAAKQMMRTRNVENDTALHEAVKFQHLEVVQILTKEDPHFSYSANEAGETPLYLAAEGGYRNLVDVILDNCSSPATEGPNGRNVLHAATIAEDEEITRKLLEKLKTGLTKQADDSGWTPLHYAAVNFSNIGRLEIVKLLLEKDECSAYIKNKQGMTALHVAASHGYHKIMKEIILRCPDSCEVVDHRGRNVLHYAVKSQKPLAVQFIMDYSSVSNYLINKKDFAGNTPFLKISTTSSFKDSILQAFLSHPRLNKMTFNKENMNILDLACTNFKLTWLQRHSLKNRLFARGIRTYFRKIIPEDDDNDDDDAALDREEIAKINKEYILVAATLIATVTFTAGFTLPGGFISNEGPLQGAAVLRKNNAFQAFMITDTIAMVLSTTAVFINIFMIVFFNDPKKKKLYHLISMLLTMAAMALMVIAFVTGTYAMLAYSLSLAIATCTSGLSFFVLLCFIVKHTIFG